MCANLVLGVILWYFEMISGCLSDSNTTRYTVWSIVSVCIFHAIFWTKTGNPLIIKCEISSSVNHMWQNISLRVTKGDLYHNMMRFLQECSSHIAKWLRHTHLLLASSHVIWHISAGYRRGVISKYDLITLRVLISFRKITLTHSYGELCCDIWNYPR